MNRIVWVTGAVAVAALASLIVSGGLDQARTAPPTVDAGTAVDLSQYSVTALDVELADAIEEQHLEAEDGETFVVVRMILENTSDSPIGLPGTVDRVSAGLINSRTALLSPSGVESAATVTAWREDDSAGPVVLQPGVPSEVRIAWPVPENTVRSGIMQLDVYDARVTTGQVLLAADQIIWRRGDLAAQISLNVGERS